MSLQPNPTSRGARIRLGPGSIQGASRVEIFDVRGRLVRRLPLNAEGAVVWDGRDENGYDVPPGVHLVRSIRADGSAIAVKRLVVVR
jgi:flagellar hook assembly protein FlgD